MVEAGDTKGARMVWGADEAIQRVQDDVRRAQSGSQLDKRPSAVFEMVSRRAW
jgi:ATP-dependent Clp protease ATP-binding subunit ClpA